MLLKANVSHSGRLSPHLARGHVAPFCPWKERAMNRPGLGPALVQALRLRLGRSRAGLAFPRGSPRGPFCHPGGSEEVT